MAIAILYAKDYKQGGFKMLPSEYPGSKHTNYHILFFTIALLGTSIGLFALQLVGIFYIVGAAIIGMFFIVIGVTLVGPLIDIGSEEDRFEPVGIFLTYPFVLAASGDAPYKNLKELAAHAKNNDVVLGHFGAGLVPTKASFAAAKKLGFEFADESAFDMLDCNSLSAGDADVINTTLALIEPCLGEINVLANIGEERIGKLPNVGTVAEQAGINNIELWNGLFVKKGTPQNVKDKIAQIAKKAMLGDAAQGLMEETGARVYWQDANESSARIATDRKKLAELNAMLK